MGLSLFLALTLASFDPQDPAWTHTGYLQQVDNVGGVVGAWFADIALYFFGYAAYLFPLGIGFVAWRFFRANALQNLDAEILLFRSLGALVSLAASAGMLALQLGSSGDIGPAGGRVGIAVGDALVNAFGFGGGNLFLFTLAVAGFSLAAGLSWLTLIDLIGVVTWNLARRAGALMGAISAWIREVWGASRADDAGEIRPLAAVTEADSSQGAPAYRRGAREPVLGDSTAREADARTSAYFDFDQEIDPVVERRFAVSSQRVIDAPLALAEVAEEDDVPRESLGSGPGRARMPTARERVGASVAVARGMDCLETRQDDSLEVKAAPAAVVTPVEPARPSARPPASKPTLDLLDNPPQGGSGYSPAALEELSRLVEVSLQHFGIEVKVASVKPGPVITCFEVEPAPGVKASQISNLSRDLARGLSVMSVRVVEVIPGKSVMGLEIPNQRREIVYLKEILESAAYKDSSAPLTLALGKDIGGHPIVANLAKMPHLLVAGTTGSGKSVAVNVMLLSILYKATPEQVRLILVDPKMLELSVYEGIPHLLAPVVTDMQEAASALRWCVAEMERRYRLMAALKVRNIAGFNRVVSDALSAGAGIPDPLYKPADHLGEDDEAPLLEPLPFIVVVIDELADMMMVVGKKVEELIARLAQKARAAGLHLIIATQRPSVDVITGLIKANIPTRIAFQVSSKIDSRTILDQMGAEQLLGHGDMLYLPPGTGYPRRVHGAFADDHEVNQVVEYLKETGEPDYINDIFENPEGGGGSGEGVGAAGAGGEIDALYDQAVMIVTETRKASISGVQRRLKIGYNRAARMIEEMESAGIVGPLQSNGGREVLAPPPPEL
jgi:S-DNA-T family DNA segregation ATPase FtsK/SpoIIIE